MKKILLSLLALCVAVSASAYDTAASGTSYYGSGCAAYGLADGTVAIYTYYTSDGQTEVVFPSTIQVWEGETMKAEYEVSAVGVDGWSSIYLGNDKTYQYDGSVTSVVVSEGIKTINASAFYEMTSLQKLTLPSTLTTIGDYAFNSCDNLKEISCAAPQLTLGTDAFKGKASWDAITAGCVLTVPDGCTANYAAYTFDNTKEWTYYDQFYASQNIREAASFTIGTDGIATYYNDYGYIMPEGVEGYLINWTNEGKANLVKVYEGGDAVCDKIALLLKSSSELTEATEFKFSVLSSGGNTATWPMSDETNYYSNLLNGTQTEQTIAAYDGDYYYYKLAKDTENGIGWYWGATDGGVFTNGAHRAYLALTKSSAGSRSFISLFDSDPTAVSKLQAANTTDAANAVYDLQGRRVSNPTRGLYIVGGRKIAIK